MENARFQWSARGPARRGVDALGARGHRVHVDSPEDWTVRSARHWAALTDMVLSRLRRPLYFALCFVAPVWAALAVETSRPSQVVLFGGFALVCLLLGVLGLMGMLDREDRLELRADDPPELREWKVAARRLEAPR